LASGAVRHVASSAAPAAVSAAVPVTAPSPIPLPEGVITPVAFAPASAAPAVAAGTLSEVLDGGTAAWAAMLGVLLLFGAVGGRVVTRRRPA
jgi:hypothetical protein